MFFARRSRVSKFTTYTAACNVLHCHHIGEAASKVSRSRYLSISQVSEKLEYLIYDRNVQYTPSTVAK